MDILGSGKIDFKGQELAEKGYYYALIITAVVGLVVGFSLQDFFALVYVDFIGLAVTLLIFVPPWPIFNQNPVKWQDPVPKVALPLKQKTWSDKLIKLLF